MFQKLQQKWRLNGWQLFLVLFTFAVGGSICGFLSKKILSLTQLEKGVAWVVIYIIIVTITWPLCVLAISLVTGQFIFFKKYISRIGLRLSGSKQVKEIRLAIFASGAGSNAARIIEHFKGHPTVKISLIVCNKPGAGVLDIAKAHHIKTQLLNRADFYSEESCVKILRQESIDWVILAGFLWKIPPVLVQAFRGRMINIHPALLPAYGGKGMYGQHVHAAVIGNQDHESGITIHYVDEIYDHGQIILQAKCPVTSSDTPETLASKIHALEHEHYPKTIESLLAR